mgnify:CR=1 FL=1
MSRVAQIIAAAGAASPYTINQSVIFDRLNTNYGSGSPRLTRSISSTGNRRKFTFSCWVKRSRLNSDFTSWEAQGIMGTSHGSWSTDTFFLFDFLNDTDQIRIYGAAEILKTNRRFTDTGGWMHIVLAIDTEQSTASNRMRLYINGVEETSFATHSVAQNTDLAMNNSTSSNEMHIATNGYDTGNGPYPYDGYMAEVYLLDGQQKTAADFGETSGDTGQWVPKETAFSSSEYGTNGFYLKFESGAIGTDSSGEGNNFTVTGVANSDIVLDTPTNNFCTLNSAQAYNSTTGVLTQGSLFFAAGAYSSGHYSNISSTFNVPASGKWYAECRISIEAGGGNVTFFGVADQRINWLGVGNENLVGADGLFASLYGDYIKVCDSGSVGTGNTSATATSYIFGMALDVDNGYAYFGVDNGSAMVWYKADGSTSGGDPTSGSTGTGGFARTFTTDDTITVSTSVSSNAGDGSQNHLNFGQNGTFCGTETAGGNTDGNAEGNFFRAPPSGYLALCTKNLPDPAIKKSSEHFSTVLYTGTGNTDLDITGVGFDPDMTWIKKRSEADDHVLTTATVGVGYVLKPHSNAVQADWTDYVGPYITDGIRLNDVQQGDAVNESGQTYVMWSWKAGGGGTSPGANTDGSINTSGTSVNTTAGISISKYSGTGSNATIGHGLGKVPSVIVLKNRSTNDNWRVFSRNDPTDYLAWNWTGGTTDDNTSWNDTAPTSTVFTVGTDTNTNRSGDSFLAICFAEVDGFSRFGTYEGNNNANGPFVHTGFQPAWLVFKYLDNDDESWWMIDTKRDPANPNTLNMFINLNNGDYDAGGVDILSNGFKPRATNGGLNGYTGTFFYMAFADFPFKYANAR